MPTELFLQDTPLPPLPDQLVPHLRYVLETAGHATLWNASAQTLVIDSPLEGRVIRCEPLGDPGEQSSLFVNMLQRRIHTAGGIVAEKGGARSDVTLLISAEPGESDDRPRVLLRGRPRGWLCRQAPLAEVVGEKLRTTLRVPVCINFHRGIQQRELQVFLWAPEEAYPAIATALWLGLMAYFRAGPPVRVPSSHPDFLSSALAPSDPQAAALASGHTPVPPPQVTPQTPRPGPGQGAAQGRAQDAAPGTAQEAGQDTARDPGQEREQEAPLQASQQAEWNQAGPVIRRIALHDPIPGTVVWSSGDPLPGPFPRRIGDASPPPFTVPLAGVPAPQAAVPAMQPGVPGQNPDPASAAPQSPGTPAPQPQKAPSSAKPPGAHTVEASASSLEGSIRNKREEKTKPRRPLR